jgi:hypothetical protein
MINVQNFLKPVPEMSQTQLHDISQRDLMLRTEAFCALGLPQGVKGCADMAILEDAIHRRGIKQHREEVILSVYEAGTELHEIAHKAHRGITDFSTQTS